MLWLVEKVLWFQYELEMYRGYIDWITTVIRGHGVGTLYDIILECTDEPTA